MTVCPKCNGKVRYQGGGQCWCDKCSAMFEKTDCIEPMTNEEWFCTLSTEEKARFFDKICYSAWGDINSRFRDMADYTDWIEWLKEMHHG